MKEDFYNLSVRESLEFLNSDTNGLSEKEADLRLQKYGRNQLKKLGNFWLLGFFSINLKVY